MGKKRYAQVGIGGRSNMYTRALVDNYAETCELVGFCDTNQRRMDLRNEEIADRHATVSTYKADDFDRMIAEQKPDWVIVTTKDCFHHTYIIRAMELGCDAVTEKPMTIDAEKCQAIIDTQKSTGRRVIVTFNYRYAPIRSKARELVMNGVIGQVRSVDFNWMLNNKHGADYFRRWHRNKENSGGLMVHKATHHFDLVNWVIDSQPETVFALGSRSYALPEQAKKLGLQDHAERCLSCSLSEKCPYFLDLRANDKLRKLYLEAEHEDGYFRDRCVFSEEIDIEDQMSVSARYRNGAFMSYSLNSFLPWEGYRMCVNGTDGRIEMNVRETSYISGDGSVPGELLKGSSLWVFPMFDAPYQPEIKKAVGGHGGGDSPLLANVFADDPPPDPLGHAATHVDGAYSILTGIAANQSFITGQAVDIDSLVTVE